MLFCWACFQGRVFSEGIITGGNFALQNGLGLTIKTANSCSPWAVGWVQNFPSVLSQDINISTNLGPSVARMACTSGPGLNVIISPVKQKQCALRNKKKTSKRGTYWINPLTGRILGEILPLKTQDEKHRHHTHFNAQVLQQNAMQAITYSCKSTRKRK